MLARIGQLLIGLWCLVGLLLVILLAAEFGIDGWRRASRRLRYGRTERPDIAAAGAANAGAANAGDWTIGYFAEFRRAARLDWKAHVGWWQRPFEGRYVTIDPRGLRRTPGEDESDPRAIRVLCFGGSALMGTGARDSGTIPAVLARRLGELGHRVSVTNYGQLGFNSTQETLVLQHVLAAGTRIDIAVFYDGVNEMICAEQTGRADGVFLEARRRGEFNLMHPERKQALLLAAAMAVLPRTLRRLRRLTGRPLRGPFAPAMVDLSAVDLDSLARQAVERYVANLRLIRALAAEYGFRPVFFWMPVLTSKRQKSPDEQRWERDFTTQPEQRRLLWNAIIDVRRTHPRLAAADTVDLSALFDETEDAVYIDLYHLSETGNAAVAEAMLPAIAARAVEIDEHAGTAAHPGSSPPNRDAG